MLAPTPRPPFDDDSRTGFEFELLCPRGKSREDLARALGRAFAADIEVGLKLHANPVNDRMSHDLSPTFRIVKNGVRILDVVDDITIVADLDKQAPTKPRFFRAVIDDPRLTLLCERVARADALDVDKILAPYLSVFDGVLLEKGAGAAKDKEHRVGGDPAGMSLVVVARYDGERERVAEVVTHPLVRTERQAFLTTLFAVFHDEGMLVPKEAALHLHLDAAPWKSTARLRQLILDADACRDLLFDEWKPNPACTRLGRFDARIVEHARLSTPTDAFSVWASKLCESGASKYVDVNILGVIHPRPKQPTIEVRCLPMSLSLDDILTSTERAESFFREVARTADDASSSVPSSA